MAPRGPRHAAHVARLNQLLVRAAGDLAIVAPAGAVDLGAWSEPQPDLMLLRPQADFYVAGHPGAADVLLLVEVSDSSLAFDRTCKRSLYARYGIGEYWIVNIPDRVLEVHRAPAERGYTERLELRCGDVIAPRTLPGTKLALTELFDPLNQ